MTLFKYVKNTSLLGRFTNIVARWPGSTHDSHIFNTSQICQQLEDNHNNLEQRLLFGDSGYALKPYLMTSYYEPATANQRAYNRAHRKTRVIIEQTFGRWKRRFHLLHSEVRMHPEKVCRSLVHAQYCIILQLHSMSQWKIKKIMKMMSRMSRNTKDAKEDTLSGTI